MISPIGFENLGMGVSWSHDTNTCTAVIVVNIYGVTAFVVVTAVVVVVVGIAEAILKNAYTPYLALISNDLD